MTDNKKYNDKEYIDKNLDRLLELGETIPKMPDELKDRIRSRLIQMEPETVKKRIFSFRWIPLPLAAAAALIFFIIFPWMGNLSGSISWADVQKKLDNIQTFAAKVNIKKVINGESRKISFARIYYKDPGLSRSEIFEQDTNLDIPYPGPQWVIKDKRKPGLFERLTFQDSKKVEWKTQVYRTTGPENPPSLIIDLASENWTIMKHLTEDNTNLIGKKVINGIRTTGFSFKGPAREIIPSSNVTGQASGKIFVKSDDGVPIYFEVEHTTILGDKTKYEITDMKWNAPFEKKGTFDFYVPRGWHVKRTSVETAEYTDTKLAPGINMYVGLDGIEPLITANDVIGVFKVEENTNPNTKIPGTMNITLEIKQSALQRLHKQEAAHPESIIVVVFNGQTKVPTMLDNYYPGRLTFDLSRLGYSISEVEKKYFTKTTTIYNGGK